MGNWIQEIFDGDVYDSGKGYNFNNVIALSNRISQTEVPDINFTLADISQNYHKTYRWTNNIQFVAGDYQFNYTTDDGMRFYINNVLVSPTSPSVNSCITQGPTDYIAPYTIPSDGLYNVRVEYFNHFGPGTAHFWWILVQAAVPPPPVIQTVPVPITTYIPPAQPPADLINVVQFSELSTSRQYVKGTMSAIGSESIIATNSSNVLTVAVSFEGIGGVTFDPTQFNLGPLQQKAITVFFDPKGFEQLGEGLNQINCVVKIAAVSIATQPSGLIIVSNVIPPISVEATTLTLPATPVTQPTTGSATPTPTPIQLVTGIATAMPVTIPTMPVTGSATPTTTTSTITTNAALARKLATIQPVS